MEHPDEGTSSEGDTASVFQLLELPSNTKVVTQSLEIARQSAAIRALESITRSVETPYIGSYFSV